VPQVAPYQLGAGAIYSPRLFTASIQARIVGPQYEDDLNTLKLDPYGVVDASASRTFARGLTAFFAIENLFDQRYQTGKTPVTGASPLATIGWPRTARVGIRVFWP
jgi:outer membrane receptor protein involved in Fe transport